MKIFIYKLLAQFFKLNYGQTQELEFRGDDKTTQKSGLKFILLNFG